MRKIFSLAFCTMLLVSGCGNLSPRISPELQEKIDNQNGKIGEIENNQNSIKNEMLNLKSQSEIHDSELREVQQGWLNLQRLFSSENNNSGVQIFSGPGGLIVALTGICAAGILAVTTLYYKSNAEKHEKIVNILSDEILKSQNPKIQQEVFKAAMYTSVEEDILKILTKKKRSI
jgi:hypothetical protein